MRAMVDARRSRPAGECRAGGGVRHPSARVLVTVEDRGAAGVLQGPAEVGGGLVLEDAELRVDVLLEARVAVQVVLGQVQEHGDLRVEAFHTFELEGGKLDDDPLQAEPTRRAKPR